MARKAAKKARPGKARATSAVRRKAKTKTARPKVAKAKAVGTHALDAFIDSAALALNIPVAAEWKPAVKANLQVILRFADNVGAFPLPDEAEPAPVFRA